MKKQCTRLLALVLALVMVFGTVPAFTVSAAEPEAEAETTTRTIRNVEKVEDGVVYYSTETVEVEAEDSAEADEAVSEENRAPFAVGGGLSQLGINPGNQVGTFSITENNSNNYEFTTFEDLQQLAGTAFDDWTYAYYEGTEPLVIAKDLALPSHLQLYSYNAEVIVPEGVTFTAQEHVNIDTLTVNGTMFAEGMNVDTKLTVTGSLHVSNYIDLNMDTEVAGLDKLVYDNEWVYLSYSDFSISDMEAFRKVLAAATASADPHVRYSVDVQFAMNITEDITIPACLSVDFYEDVTVASGATLSFLGTSGGYYSSSIYTPITVYGTLVNEGELYLGHGSGGLLTIAEGGTYSGKGTITVSSKELTDVQDALPGLNLAVFEIDQNYNGRWELRNISGLVKLGTPTELKWGYDTQWDWDIDEGNTILVEGAPGMVSWKTALPDLNQVDIEFYRVTGDTEEYAFGGGWSFGSDIHEDYRAVEDFLLEGPESGDYYFTITSEGDYTQYRNSDTAKSGIYHYVKPAAQLEKCTNLTWDFPQMSWDAPANNDMVLFYHVEYYFSPTAEGTPTSRGGVFGIKEPSDSIWKEFMQDNGIGYYYFKVKAVSSNLEQICNSEWSELSPAYNLAELVFDVEDKVTNIVDNPDLSTEEKVEAVQNLNSEELQYAMLTDETVVEQLAALEEEAGGAADVQVSKDAAAFDASKISVVGANLNTTTGTEGATLVVDKPEKDHVIPEAYNNAVAVSFSMDLENVPNTEELEVPVQITLPVPSTINPNFLVILHYHMDGSHEEIWPHITEVNGQTYATFVLTSFSDFTMVEAYPFDRVAGADRYETAFFAADLLRAINGGEKFSSIVVACGTDFADALSGSYLANQKNAPVLLVRNNKNTIAAVKEYIQKNLKAGGTVYLLGGTNAIPKTMETGLEGFAVKRLAGATRYDTNLEILKEAGAAGKPVLVCTGKDFADGLSASAVNLPILLVKDSLSTAQINWIKSVGVKEFYIIGGKNAVNTRIESALGGYGTVKRIEGATRYNTSVNIAKTFFPESYYVVLAYGDNFPDGLSGGPLACALGSPLILTKGGKQAIATEYTKSADVYYGIVLGGSKLITDKVANAILSPK